MKQWEIRLFQFSQEGLHPAVIISNDERCSHTGTTHVNALFCSTLRAARPAKVNEVILNGSDGLDWQSVVKCDLMYLLPKSGFSELKGTVSRKRRRAISRRIVDSFKLTMF